MGATGLPITDSGMCLCFKTAEPRTDSRAKVKDVKGLVGDSKYSPVVQNTQDPQYNFVTHYQFNFKLSMFKFQICDREREVLGECKVGIGEFFANMRVGEPCTLETTLPLTRHGQHRGEVHVKITPTFYIPAILPGTLFAVPPLFQCGIGWDFSKKTLPFDLDASVVALDDDLGVKGTLWWKNLKEMQLGAAVHHSGDDTTGEGDGDDETISFNLGSVSPDITKLVITINSFNGQSISNIKFAYFRLIVNGHTIAFYGMGKGQVPNSTGLIVGCLQRSAHNLAQWEFQTIVAATPGKTVMDSLPQILEFFQSQTQSPTVGLPQARPPIC
eukprot:TRINITY_DN7627_c0_g2_i1.p1 TRINITY_DN7627_c0_g2~~TRINITY_DN7627_c0_g2_i1.p1  ORF type:complete len:329 (+),score=78.51 TRINITY_DN7627_c0_g2_i1:213-1199(+)